MAPAYAVRDRVDSGKLKLSYRAESPPSNLRRGRS
jgi:hypothetical protein